jgi:preprotein translocase subunit YajC
LGYLIVIVGLFVLVWLFLLRPQRRRQVEQLRMQDTLHVGDEIVTAGGIRGRVQRLDDEVLGVEIAPGVEVRVDRRAVAGVIGDDGEDAELERPERVTQDRSFDG